MLDSPITDIHLCSIVSVLFRLVSVYCFQSHCPTVSNAFVFALFSAFKANEDY